MSRRIVFIVSLVSLVLMAWHAPLAAQTGRIRGKVADSTGAALAGAVITVEGTPFRTTTGAQGTYEIRNVPSGLRTLRARLIGYTAATVQVTVVGGGDVSRDFVLSRSAVQLAPVNVVVGSRAQHAAAEELAVPVDVFNEEAIKHIATTETSEILSKLSPSVNFPRQSVSDASDIVRPFTLRGLSPDHALVLVNGWRRHHTALVHNFAAGMGAGSSGVDMNALPASAIDRIEILRDGAAAQYGSDAIAGVVNVVMKEGGFSPFLKADAGVYATPEARSSPAYLGTGGFTSASPVYNLSGGWGIPVGRGSIAIFGEYRHRDATNRAGAENADQIVGGDADVVDPITGEVITKNNDVAQPNHHWGDGMSSDALAFLNAKFPLNASGSSELYAFGGYSHRVGTGNGFRRQGISDRNWPEIYPLGYLPEFHPTVIDASGAAGLRGTASGWAYDAGLSFGYNSFLYDLRNTMNVSLGPCLTTACAPGLDGILGNADDPGIPNQTQIDAGTLKLNELDAAINISKPLKVGLPGDLNLATGLAFRSESYQIVAGEKASYIQGGSPNRYGDPAPPGSQVFGGFQPSNAVDSSRSNVGAYLDLETNLSKKFLVNAAGRFEHYSDFGSKLTGKLALRFAPSKQVTLRAALSTGFRAPSPSQRFYGATITNFVLDPATGRQKPVEGGIFPVYNPAAIALGAKPLEAENSVNVSGGLAFSPIDRLTFTADAFYVKINGRIILTGVLGGDSVEAILRGEGVDNVATAQYFTNALDTETKGADLTATWRVPMPAGKRIDLSGVVNWTQNRIMNVTEPPELEGTGAVLFDPYVSGGRIALEKERPDWRSTLTGEYGSGGFRAQLRTEFYGPYTTSQLSGVGPEGGCNDCVQRISSAVLVDAEVGYLLGGRYNLSIGARNLLDHYPTKLNTDNSFGIFLYPQPSPYGYNGRFIYTRLEVTFGN